MAAIPKDKKEAASPVGECEDPGEALIEALASQSGNLMESPSPVTADKVEIEKAVPSSDRHLIPEGVYTVAGETALRRLGPSKMRFEKKSFTPLESRLPMS